MEFRTVAATLLALGAAASAAADPVAFGGALPSTSGDTGLFRLPGAYVLAPGHFSVHAFHDERRQRVGEDVDLDGLAGAVGVADRVEAFGHVARDRFHEQTHAALGLKWQLRDDRAGERVALAARGEVDLAGGGGGRVEGVVSTWHYAGVAGHAVLGLSRRDGDDAFRWGGGLQWQVARRVDVEGEIVGERRLGAGPRHPLDATLGVTVALPGRAFVRGALTQALRPPYGGSSRQGMAVHVSLGLHPGPAPARRVVAP